MAATINTNSISLNAQRNLSSSQNSLATSMQRLSSGLRVNSAKDDAAGLAIAERMNTQVRGQTVAARNANDGISLGQTAEGALGKVGDMLQRMRELAVQASNATNSKADRAALQAEVAQLRDEVDRVAKQTSFNGTKILDGSFSGAVFQVGSNSGDNITVGALVNTTAAGLSKVAYAYNSETGIQSSSVNDLTAITDSSALNIQDGTNTWYLGPVKEASSGTERMGQMIEAINRKSADTGVTAFLTQDASGTYTIDIVSSHLDSAGDAVSMTLNGFTVANAGHVGTIGSEIDAANTTTDAIGIDTLSIATQRDAWVALKKIDNALDQVNRARADLGALQSRFENSVANVEIQIENLAAARGRIVDADFAKETANLSRTQILQQAGTAMVAQANQLPQQVLQLLQQ
ncbi:flagellin [Pseudorhodoferax sp. Leaf265]|jgi:flagellin|uniref:flagellin N-terminal helical domain-containing protein n=1 Tax=Pseudorhodoferax sp. Leaf265 TaxID=1736315 RepID=UPI0006FFF7B6|nr:flagellin [Pseudorhodoferax sp. Leaf265]KQP08320.1 flagellin [Pseudorhodoferax sp. Leaf265]PZP91660.1 MAG: flagellin [Variovorax paradoxus]PZQ01683.1 MAG: flagellin [Variovorax paradoxus]